LGLASYPDGLFPTSGEESDLDELGLDDDPREEEAEGGHQVDEGCRRSSVVPRIPKVPKLCCFFGDIIFFFGRGGCLVQFIGMIPLMTPHWKCTVPQDGRSLSVILFGVAQQSVPLKSKVHGWELFRCCFWNKLYSPPLVN
jgi:hypothetical protein